MSLKTITNRASGYAVRVARPWLFHPAGSARRMSTGTERGGIRMTFQGLPRPNSTLTLLNVGSYTLSGAVGFIVLSPTGFSHLRIDTEYSFFIQDLLRRSTEGARVGTLETVETYAFIAGMPSLQMAHETIMLFFSRSSRLMLQFSAMFWLSSFLAVLVLGWHYLFDVIGGICLACAVLFIVRWVSQPDTERYGSGS